MRLATKFNLSLNLMGEGENVELELSIARHEYLDMYVNMGNMMGLANWILIVLMLMAKSHEKLIWSIV